MLPNNTSCVRRSLEHPRWSRLPVLAHVWIAIVLIGGFNTAALATDCDARSVLRSDRLTDADGRTVGREEYWDFPSRCTAPLDANGQPCSRSVLRRVRITDKNGRTVGYRESWDYPSRCR
jgi:hypothetical protein